MPKAVFTCQTSVHEGFDNFVGFSFHQLPTKRAAGTVHELLQRTAASTVSAEHDPEEPESLPARWARRLAANHVREQPSHRRPHRPAFQRHALHSGRGSVISTLIN